MNTGEPISPLESDKRERLRRPAREVAKSGAKLLLGFVAILVFASALWLGFSAYVQSTTVPADGEIIQKQEIIEFGRADNWSREFEITFRYRAGGDANWTTASHNVNRTTYEHLNVGTSVGVHYSRYGLLRQIPGTGSYIEGTSAISRLPHGLSTQDLLLFGALLLFALTGLGALARASRGLAVLSLVFLGVFSPDTMLAFFALVIFPTLFWAWRKKPGEGYGWLLVVVSANSIAVTYWRVPGPDPLPSGSQGSTQAVVNRLKVVTNIWDVSSPGSGSGRGRSGQKIQTPFYLVDLQFTPAGAIAPVHAVDRVDINGSTLQLHSGSSVKVIYAGTEPHAAQIAVATRTFGRAIFTYVMLLTLCSTAIVTFVAVPVLWFLNSFWEKLAMGPDYWRSSGYSSSTKSNVFERITKDR